MRPVEREGMIEVMVRRIMHEIMSSVAKMVVTVFAVVVFAVVVTPRKEDAVKEIKDGN